MIVSIFYTSRLSVCKFADMIVRIELTFIILKRGNDTSLDSLTSASIAQLDLPENMIGDVNLFLSDAYESEDEEEDAPSSSKSKPPPPPTKRAEIELMIALTSVRRSGYGIQSIQLFLSYSSQILGLKPSQFFAKIGMDNSGSIKLFEKLGFVKGKVSEIFQEVEMIWNGGDGWNWEEGYEMIEYLE